MKQSKNNENWDSDNMGIPNIVKSYEQYEFLFAVYREELKFLMDSFASRMEPCVNDDPFERVLSYLYFPFDKKGEFIVGVDYSSTDWETETIEKYLIKGPREYTRVIARRIRYLFNQIKCFNDLE